MREKKKNNLTGFLQEPMLVGAFLSNYIEPSRSLKSKTRLNIKLSFCPTRHFILYKTAPYA